MESMRWVLYACITAMALAVADCLVKYAAGKLSHSVALLLYGGCAFLAGIGWVLWQYIHGAPQYMRLSGAVAALGVGVAFSVVVIGLYITFGAGAPISVASPLIRLGGLLVASVVGLVILNEPLSWRYSIGMLLALSGVYLIVTR